jgi:dihydroorotase
VSAPILIRGGRVIDPSQRLDGVRDLLVRDGKVAQLAEKVSPPPDAVEVKAQGKWVLPGLIDLHVHFREPGEEGKETIATGCKAAVAGGFTSVVTMPNTSPVNDSALVTRLILDRAREAQLCRVYPAGAISKGQQGEELAEIGDLADAGCVCITDDGQPVMSAGLMRRALQYAQRFDLPVMAHEEDLTLSRRGAMSEGTRSTRMGLAPVPASAEVAMVARDLVLAEETGGRLHLAHLSCARSVELVREAKRRGIRVTAEVTPHHFTLTDAAVEGYDTHAKMSPPLRRPEDVRALCAAMADGTVDAIATDHAPHGVLDKQVEFDKAANGVVGLETSLGLALELVRAGQLSLERAVELLTSSPARAFSLPGGTLAVGAAADWILVDPERSWTVDAGQFQSKGRNTPFHGRTLVGRVLSTWVGGRQVYEREERG